MILEITNLEGEVEEKPEADPFVPIGQRDVDGRVNRLESELPLYGSLYEDNSSGTNITLTTAGTFYQWVSSTKGLDSGIDYVVASVTDDDIKIGKSGAGIYYVAISASFRGSNTASIHGAVHLNDAEQVSIEFEQKLATADMVTGAASGLLKLVRGDVVDLRFTSDTNTTTLTVEHVALLIFRLRK